jgi:hypothetical protein
MGEAMLPPCGSPNCLAVTVEKALEKTIDTQRETLKELFKEQITAISGQISTYHKKLDKDLDEMFLRLRTVESDSKTALDRQVGMIRFTQFQFDMRAEAERVRSIAEEKIKEAKNLVDSKTHALESKIVKIEESVFTKEQKELIMDSCRTMKEQKDFLKKVKLAITLLLITSFAGWILYIYNIHPMDTVKLHEAVQKADSNEQTIKTMEQKLDAFGSNAEYNKKLLERLVQEKK